MATVDKNFKVKNGLVVEGTTATVNGNDILTTANTTSDLTEGTNKYFTDQRAKDAAASLITNATKTNIVITGDGNGLTITAENGVADSTTDDLAEGSTNLYFTNERAQDAIGLNLDNGLVYDDVSGKVGVKIGNSDGGVLTFANDGRLQVNHDGLTPSPTSTLTSQGSGNILAVNTNVIATKSYVDGLASNYDPAGAAALAQSNAEAYTDTAVANLVDGAPALLNTLNELAAAIADNPNYATDVANLVATKADLSYVDAQNAALDTAAQSYATLAENNAKSYADGLAVNYDAAGSAATAETNAKTYAKNYADGLAVNYDAAGSATSAETAAKSYADSLAVNYDAAGAATAAEGNAKAYADSLAVNYDPAGSAASAQTAAETSANAYTDTAISNGNIQATPKYAGIGIGYYATEVAGYTFGNTGSVLTAYTFGAGVKSGKFVVRVMSNATGDSQMSEILVTADSSNNVAITEYAIVSTNGNMGDVTADVDGSGNIRIIVTPTHDNSEVMVSGTVFIWNN